MISVIIPHLRTVENDKALEIALQTCYENADGKVETIIPDEVGCCYRAINNVVDKAKSDWLMFSNSDVFFGPMWDVEYQMAQENDQKAIYAPYLVECGAIGVASENIHADFGWRPETFNRVGFERFVQNRRRTTPYLKQERGWYFPCMIHRDWFKELGMFDVDRGAFPEPLDIWFWEKHIAAGGKLFRVGSFAYHLQNFSTEGRVDRAGR